MFVVNDFERAYTMPSDWGEVSDKAIAHCRRRSRQDDGLADSDARVGYRISVCSSGAASICQRASLKSSATQFIRGFPTEAPPPALRAAVHVNASWLDPP